MLRRSRLTENASNNTRSEMVTTSDNMPLTPRSICYDELESSIIQQLVHQNSNLQIKQNASKTSNANENNSLQFAISDRSFNPLNTNSALGMQDLNGRQPVETKRAENQHQTRRQFQLDQQNQSHEERTRAIKEIVIINQTTGNAIKSDSSYPLQIRNIETVQPTPQQLAAATSTVYLNRVPSLPRTKKLTTSYAFHRPIIEVHASAADNQSHADTRNYFKKRNKSLGYQGWSQGGIGGKVSGEFRQTCGGDSWQWIPEDEAEMHRNKQERDQIDLPFDNSKKQFWRRKAKERNGNQRGSVDLVLDNICNQLNISHHQEDIEEILQHHNHGNQLHPYVANLKQFNMFDPGMLEEEE